MNLPDVPLAWSFVSHLKQYHWAIDGDAIIAKAVGGCGIHNAMLYVRALPENIKSWGMRDWSWNEVLEQYLLLEKNVEVNTDNEFHGKNGPIVTSSPIVCLCT
jgi:choline dehydrogenase-like flavoprotein